MKQYSKLAIVILLLASCSQQEATYTDFESENIETSTQVNRYISKRVNTSTSKQVNKRASKQVNT